MGEIGARDVRGVWRSGGVREAVVRCVEGRWSRGAGWEGVRVVVWSECGGCDSLWRECLGGRVAGEIDGLSPGRGCAVIAVAVGDHFGNAVIVLSLGAQRTCSLRANGADGAVVRIGIN